MKAADWIAAHREGALIHEWAPLAVEANGHHAVLRVSADAVRVQRSDGSRVREGAGAYACQAVADVLGALMITAALVERRHVAATVQLDPIVAGMIKPGGTVSSVTAFEASERIDKAIQRAAGTAGPWLISNVGKHFVLDEACSEPRKLPSGEVVGAVNHGFIVRASDCRVGADGQLAWRGIHVFSCAVLGPEWKIIQLRGKRHGFGPTNDQDDYSQGLLVVDDICTLDGHECPTVRLYTEAEFALLVTHDGKPLLWARHPGVMGIPMPILDTNTDNSTAAPVAKVSPPTLRRDDPDAGQKREWIERWQRIVGATADGIFGPGTEQRTRVWQAAHGLTADGVVGPKSWAEAEDAVPDTDPVPKPQPQPESGKGQFILATRTPTTPQDVYAALIKAWRAQLGTEPKRESLLVLLAQWAHETGTGRATWCYNLGNVKAKPGGARDYTFFTCGEELTREQAQALLKDARVSVVKEYSRGGTTMVSVRIVPDHPACCFRAFRTLDDGAADFLELLRKRFASAWPAVEDGDPAAFAHLLRLARYYTASVESYTRALKAHFDTFSRSIA